MNSHPLPLLLAAALALPALPAFGQEDPKSPQPAPVPPPPSAQRPPEPDRPPGRGGPRDERHEGRGDGRHDGPRGPEEGRRFDDGPRREGDRGPGDRGFVRGWTVPLPPPAVPTPYIGVVTLPPPAVLSAQLGLKEGFGLVVADVLPDSPATKAGVQKNDVLTKFNDQQLVDSGQFATLVRGAGKDTEATLTLFRAGKEQTVPVKIGERMAPQRMPVTGTMELHGQVDKLRNSLQENTKRLQDRMKDFGEKMRDFQDKFKGWQKNPAGEMPKPPTPPSIEPENASYQISPEDVLMHAGPGGMRQIRMLQPNGPVSFYTGDARMFLKDDSGDVEVSTKEGKRILMARNLDGVTIFNGPIDTEDQRKDLPEDVRKKVELILVRSAAPVEAPFVQLSSGDNVQ